MFNRIHVMAICVFVCIETTAAQAQATQSTGYTLDDVLTMVKGSMPSERVLTLLKENCIAFPAAERQQQLRDAGADDVLLNGLTSICYLGPTLRVTTHGSQAEVWYNGNKLGTAPFSGGVSVGTGVVEVRNGGIVRSAVVNLQPGTSVDVSFELPSQALPSYAPPSREEIASQMEQSFHPTTQAPVKPANPPSKHWTGRLIGLGLAGAAVAVAHAAWPPCNDEDYSLQRCSRYSATSGLAIGGFTALWAFPIGLIHDTKAYHAHQKMYELAVQTYQTANTAWLEQRNNEWRTWVASNPAITAALQAEEARARLEYQQKMHALTAGLPEPVIEVHNK